MNPAPVILVAFGAWIALLVAVLALKRRPSDAESLPILAGKVVLVHMIFAVSVLLLLAPHILLSAGALAIGLYAAYRLDLWHRLRQSLALEWWNNRLTTLNPAAPTSQPPTTAPPNGSTFDDLAAQIDSACSKDK
jgi:hypothetical protein